MPHHLLEELILNSLNDSIVFFFLVFLTASEQKYKEDQIIIPRTVYSIRAHLCRHMNERVGRRMKISFLFPSFVFFLLIL